MRTMWMSALVLALGASVAQAQTSKPATKPAAKAPPAATTAPAAPPDLSSEDAKTIYALGVSVGRDLSGFALTPEEVQLLQRGIADSIAGTAPAVDAKEYGPKIQAFAKARQAQANTAALERAAKAPGATKLSSGVIYLETQAGTGKSPRATDTVKVHYEGRLVDGTVFDSSAKRGIPVEFPLNGVIPCWTQGVAKMKVGGKAQLTCPGNTAYGERPPPGSRIPPNAVLIFDVELVDIPGDTSKAP
ncbi:FKBP-type peptidyl-prolyl cis-trans isomerase [Pyxidicoccus fallax]|uniref:Peptidyl-prolyl cis-trans isomerase n=1 Tax=Pyxidicoccus fallax TaxID=394095 RepID=A0A848L590_9BACT|nr:FKBP-type peptidyl-prolyl cis-trans isomerase [Pyxidicoccus fallax]NMO13859.1 FKBP-type peptidyl-prolyl cis-trans isomerase [Pyxidicoccus fallax]NPC77651.1 FKBP-type peptidyl-prolyl cis-trans isomerase [Pyxidicoccus fallax]